MSKAFSILVKPASADCNLNCHYCFYRSRKNLYPDESNHRMTDGLLQRIVSSYMSTPQDTYAFGWQGGEPTLMGVDFFRRVVMYQIKYGRADAVISNSLQTNATRIDDELAQHFAQYRFLVGVSLDGPASIHNYYRRTIAGRESHTKVVQGISTLQRNNVTFNILVLVNNINVKEALSVYDYLCENGWYYHQYIPCVEYGESATLLDCSINGNEWGDFLCTIFDRWVKSDVGKVSVGLFETLLSVLLNDRTGNCQMGIDCCRYFVVEYNGDIYPCDFYVDRKYQIGNIKHSSWEQLQCLPTYTQFGKQKREWNEQCVRCQYLSLCAGDCLKHRLSPRYGYGVSHLCEGWRQFYQHCLADLNRIAGLFKKERRLIGQEYPPGNNVEIQKKVGRNDPCPCGSNLKYKRCCGSSLHRSSK